MEAVVAEFRKLDGDGDGHVTKTDLRRALHALEPSNWTDKRVGELLRTIDRNGDGRIQFEEFVSWLYQGSELTRTLCSPEARDGASWTLEVKFRAACSAAKAGDFGNAIRLMREHPELANMRQSSTGETLLHQAALQGSGPALWQLMELRADPSLTSKAGQTALDVAVEGRSEEAVEVLRRVVQGAAPDGAAAVRPYLMRRSSRASIMMQQ